MDANRIESRSFCDYFFKSLGMRRNEKEESLPVLKFPTWDIGRKML